MALNRKTFKKAAAGAAADTNLPSGYFNTVLYTGNGGTQRIGGYINRGAVFNGSSSKIEVSSFTTDTTFSLSFWMRASDPNSDNVLFHFRNTSSHIAANNVGIAKGGAQFGLSLIHISEPTRPY